MKEISKVKAYIQKSINSILNERHILKHIHHNFISNLYFSFQDKDYLYLILDYFSGGDLRFYLNKNVQFNEKQIKFCVSNIILSLKYLHQNYIIHRDIKPENLVFDEKGYLNLSDFGISKKIKRNKQIKERSCTPGYSSPETILKKNQTFVCDYFPIGIIIYELIFLKRPFNGKNKQEIFENILYKNINLKKKNLPKMFIDSSSANELIDFINKLLKKKVNERLGAKGINEIIQHPWLKGTDWDNMEGKLFNEEEMPFIPSPGDNFDYLKVIDKINEKYINYNSYLKLINNSTLFNSFYFNSYSNERKILSSNNVLYKDLSSENEDDDKEKINKRSETITNKNRQNIKNDIYNSRNESNDSNEYTLSEYTYEEDDFIFNRDTENDGRISGEIKNKRICISPKKSLNGKYIENRNSIF